MVVFFSLEIVLFYIKKKNEDVEDVIYWVIIYK